MSRKPSPRIVRAVADRLWERDRLQMRAVDALLSAVEPKRRRLKRPPRKRLARQMR
jgi:hypothetical protein